MKKSHSGKKSSGWLFFALFDVDRARGDDDRADDIQHDARERRREHGDRREQDAHERRIDPEILRDAAEHAGKHFIRIASV